MHGVTHWSIHSLWLVSWSVNQAALNVCVPFDPAWVTFHVRLLICPWYCYYFCPSHRCYCVNRRNTWKGFSKWVWRCFAVMLSLLPKRHSELMSSYRLPVVRVKCSRPNRMVLELKCKHELMSKFSGIWDNVACLSLNK